jgi:hypothetical protein
LPSTADVPVGIANGREGPEPEVNDRRMKVFSRESQSHNSAT